MGRSGALFLSFVLVAQPAAATVAEIPAKYLEQEARLQRTLSPKAKARVHELTARLNVTMTVADVKALTSGETTDNIFLVMVEYLKMLQKEAREDRKMARGAASGALAAKESKLRLESSKIEAEKREADERFQHAMEAADKEMWLGVVSGGASAISAGAAVGAAASVQTKTPTRTPLSAPRLKTR